jgi:hypothetical protein
VECLVRGLDAQIAVEDDERIDDGVEDRLRVFAFVNRLFDAGAKSGDVREGEHDAGGVPIGAAIGRGPKHIPRPVVGPDLTLDGRPARSDMVGQLLDVGDHAG